MIFENSLKSLEKKPISEFDLQTCYAIANELDSSDEKAFACARLAEVLFQSNFSCAFEKMKEGFLLSPNHEKVIEVLTRFFSKRMNTQALKLLNHEKNDGKSEPVISKVLTNNSWESAGDIDIIGPKIIINEPGKEISALFADFAVKADLPDSVLDFEKEFSTSLLGIIQFVSYLNRTRKITSSEFERCCKILQSMIDESPDISEAAVRFKEIVHSGAAPSTPGFKG